MKKVKFYIVDVFTDQQFGGNQLAVFPEGNEVPEELMQKIAREINYSETTFVLPAENNKNDFKLRIFTPYLELPMAGHPTVGSAFALLKNNYIAPDKDSIIFEEGVGDIPVAFKERNNSLVTAMEQPLPVFGPKFESDIMAKILSLSKDQILSDYPVQVVSSGVPFLYVPVKDLNAIRKIKLRMDYYEKYLAGFPTNNLFVFTMETEQSSSFVHSRMFAPGYGIAEDPATGAASGPLGAYLVHYGLAEANKPLISEQGFEMGRPSLIQIEIAAEGKQIHSVKVGGQSVLTGEGYIYLN
jgi:trans-2,3-dihydro-3-hydroxyanthranilate isomerase